MEETNPDGLKQYNEWRARQGLSTFEEAPPIPEGVKTPRKQHGFLLTDEAYEGLRIIAYEQGFSNPTQLLEAVGLRKWPE